MKTSNCLAALAISAMITFGSCQKDPEIYEIASMTTASAPEVEKDKLTAGWKRIEGLPERPVFNLSYENGEILALGNSDRFQINPSSLFVKSERFGSFSEDYSTTLDQKFFTKISKSTIFVYSTPEPGIFSTLEMESIDPLFGQFIALPGCYSQAIASTGSSTYLTAYSRKSSTEINGANKVFLLLFKATIGKSGQVVISDVMTIPVKGLTEKDRLLTVFPSGERFFVSFDSKTLVVSTQGRVFEVNDYSIFEIISYDDLLLGFGTDRLFCSRDNGVTWNTFTRKGPAHFQYWMQKGFQYQNSLITSSPTGIFRLDIKLEDSAFFVREIPADELQLDKEHIIYDMIKTEKYLLVATSKGVFFRNLEEEDKNKPA